LTVKLVCSCRPHS